jgi:hypothetical protein
MSTSIWKLVLVGNCRWGCKLNLHDSDYAKIMLLMTNVDCLHNRTHLFIPQNQPWTDENFCAMKIKYYIFSPGVIKAFSSLPTVHFTGCLTWSFLLQLNCWFYFKIGNLPCLDASSYTGGICIFSLHHLQGSILLEGSFPHWQEMANIKVSFLRY